MDGFELNKIAASVLIAGLIAMMAGNITDFLYRPEPNPAKRGFQVEVTEATNTVGQTPASEPQITKEDIMKFIKAGNVERGQDIAKKCSLCHTFTQGGANGVGPNLWNIVGGPQHHKSDYSYSSVLQAASDKWSYENLFHFINSPRKFLPGTKMTFVGLSKPQDLADLIMYLRTLSDNPLALPE